jgi:predicted RNase H-like HicB family nuclease
MAESIIKDDGTVHIYASKQEGLDRAKAMIDRMFQEIEVAKVYTGKVVSVTQFGAFMEVLPGKDGFWVAECPSLSGCISQGQNREEAVINIREAIEGYIRALQEDELPVPSENFEALLLAV